jgi:hypothetical protein
MVIVAVMEVVAVALLTVTVAAVYERYGTEQYAMLHERTYQQC